MPPRYSYGHCRGRDPDVFRPWDSLVHGRGPSSKDHVYSELPEGRFGLLGGLQSCYHISV